MTRHALVVGATGISGGNLVTRLLSDGWQVSGLSRRPDESTTGMRGLAADLLDPAAVAAAVKGTRPTHVFFTTWSRCATEAENCAINGAMLANLLGAVRGEGTVEHVALVTGLKHYLGPFEAYAKAQPDTPFSEEQARLPYQNFYYVQEDLLWAAAERDGFTWSVHRPHTLIGWALGNAMNMGVTLAVYAAICREIRRPFRFPGSKEQWEAVTDVTDARLLAEHLVWAATTPAAANTALNIVNGDVFRWRRLWPKLAEALAVESAPYSDAPEPLEQQMAGAEAIWPSIVHRHGLRDIPVNTLASWWHTDADLGRTIETFTDMGRSRRLGFDRVQDTLTSFTDIFAQLAAAKIVPSHGAG
jgi:nucleoside-diphosphate-sugar epimerase